MHGKFDDLGRFADPSLLILTSLSDGPKHGYAIMSDVTGFSGVRMEPGTLYGALSRAVFPSGSPQPSETPLCATCDGLGNYAVAFAPAGRTLTVVVDRAEMSANSGRDTIFDWPVTGSGALGAVTVAARDVADFQPVIAPGDRTVLGSPPGSHAWHTWPLP